MLGRALGGGACREADQPHVVARYYGTAREGREGVAGFFQRAAACVWTPVNP